MRRWNLDRDPVPRSGDRRPRPGATVDLLLIAGVFVTGLVLIVIALWVVPTLAIAALASASDEA